MTGLTDLSITEALAQLQAREISSVELTRAHLDRIEQIDPQIRAYLTITADAALSAAEHADLQRAAGDSGPLLGIPLGIKDVLSTQTCG